MMFTELTKISIVVLAIFIGTLTSTALSHAGEATTEPPCTMTTPPSGYTGLELGLMITLIIVFVGAFGTVLAICIYKRTGCSCYENSCDNSCNFCVNRVCC